MRTAVFLAAASLSLCLAGCAARGPVATGPARTPEDVFRSLVGHNPGLSSLRAVAEARISFAGREVSFPGVLLLDTFGGFRIDLLDPFDRPLAILYAEGGRVVQYRPAQRMGASLGVFPEGCRSIDPAAWVQAVTASRKGPFDGGQLVGRSFWGGDLGLVRNRGGEPFQSFHYREEGGVPRASLVSWYCDGEPVLKLRLQEWITGDSWQLPSRFEVEYPAAGLRVRIEVGEVEVNPPPASMQMVPRIDSEARWSTWNLPQ